MEDWTCLGQHKRQPEFPVVTRESCRNSRKTTWLPRHRKMKPFPATAPQEKSHVRNWRSKRSEEHTSELQSPLNLVCRLLLEKKKNTPTNKTTTPNLPPTTAHPITNRTT